MTLKTIYVGECYDTPNGFIHTRMATTSRDLLHQWLKRQGYQRDTNQPDEDYPWERYHCDKFNVTVYMRSYAVR